MYHKQEHRPCFAIAHIESFLNTPSFAALFDRYLEKQPTNYQLGCVGHRQGKDITAIRSLSFMSRNLTQ